MDLNEMTEMRIKVREYEEKLKNIKETYKRENAKMEDDYSLLLSRAELKRLDLAKEVEYILQRRRASRRNMQEAHDTAYAELRSEYDEFLADCARKGKIGHRDIIEAARICRDFAAQAGKDGLVVKLGDVMELTFQVTRKEASNEPNNHLYHGLVSAYILRPAKDRHNQSHRTRTKLHLL